MAQSQTAWAGMMALNTPHKFLHTLRRYADRFTGRRRPYLLFDAGGTIVFPNVDLMIKQLARRGWRMRPDQLYEGYYQVVHKLDDQAGQQPGGLKIWPKGFAYELFDELGIIDPNTSQLAVELQKQHKQTKNLWTFTYPWVRKTLAWLYNHDYRMSVLSNSDGRARQVICEVGLMDYFEDVFDSHDLGIAKPDPRIFDRALKALRLTPSEVIYIGDIFEVDVKGANCAGIGAIHIDPLGKYAGQRGVHIRDIRDLPDWLETNRSTKIEELDLYPFRDTRESLKTSQPDESRLSPSATH